MNDYNDFLELINDSDDAEFIESCMDLMLESDSIVDPDDSLKKSKAVSDKYKAEYKKIVSDYKTIVTQLKASIKSGEFDKARTELSKATDKINDGIKLINSIDSSALDTCMSWMIDYTQGYIAITLTMGTLNTLLGIGNIAGKVSSDTVKKSKQETMVAQASVAFTTTFNNAVSIYKAYDPSLDPAKALNPARARIVLSLQQCKKHLLSFEKKINKKELKLNKKQGQSTNESAEYMYDALVDAICEKFSNDEISANDAIMLMERAADKYL